MKFIVLHHTDDRECFINATEIRGIFAAGNGSSINIGTMGNIPVVETPRDVIDLIARAFDATVRD